MNLSTSKSSPLKKVDASKRTEITGGSPRKSRLGTQISSFDPLRDTTRFPSPIRQRTPPKDTSSVSSSLRDPACVAKRPLPLVTSCGFSNASTSLVSPSESGGYPIGVHFLKGKLSPSNAFADTPSSHSAPAFFSMPIKPLVVDRQSPKPPADPYKKLLEIGLKPEFIIELKAKYKMDDAQLLITLSQ